MRKLAFLIVVATATLVAIVAGAARADSNTVYHYTNQVTGACANVTFPQENWFDTTVGPPNTIDEAGALKVIADGGVFKVGYVATGQVDVVTESSVQYGNMYVGGPSLDPNPDDNPPVSGGPYYRVDTYLLATGACPVTPQMMAQVDHVGACASQPVLRGDGTMGTFLDIAQGYLASGQWDGVTFTPANYAAGKGLTCDNLPGYAYAGYNVSGDGTVDTAAPQFNVYPYYTLSG